MEEYYICNKIDINMLRIITLVVLISMISKLNAQEQEDTSPPLAQNFLMVLSPESTYEGIASAQAELNDLKFDLEIDHLTFDQNYLESFEVAMNFDCPGKSQQRHKSKIQLNSGVPYPLHAIFIGEDCSHGTFSTNDEELKKLLPLLFPVNGPSHLLRVEP